MSYVGINLGKSDFAIHGVDDHGKPTDVLRMRELPVNAGCARSVFGRRPSMSIGAEA